MKTSFTAKLILAVAVCLCCRGATHAVFAASESVQKSSMATKPVVSPCQGLNQSLSENYKANLARAVAKQINGTTKLKVSSVDVIQSFASDNWSIVYVNTHVSDELFLIYSGNPLTNRYVTLWAGAAMIEDEPIMKAWVLKNAPGIPPKLASCFARRVTLGD